MKKTPFFLVLFMLCSRASAQIHFNHAAGARFMLAETGGRSPLMTGVVYAPRLTYRLFNYGSVSICAPVSLGGDLFDEFLGQGNDLGYAELPLLAEFGFGHLANSGEEYGIGMLAGAGIDQSWYFGSGNLLTWRFEAGLRFPGNFGSSEIRLNVCLRRENLSDMTKAGLSYLYIIE